MVGLLILALLAGLVAASLAVFALLVRLFPSQVQRPNFKTSLQEMRWLLYVTPALTAAIMAGISFSNSKSADIAEHAKRSASFTITGELSYSDLRHRVMIIRTAHDTHGINCAFTVTRSYCVRDKVILPRIVTAKAFDYDGDWVFLELRDISGRVLVSEADRRDDLASEAQQSALQRPAASGLLGLLFGLILDLFFVVKARILSGPFHESEVKTRPE